MSGLSWPTYAPSVILIGSVIVLSWLTYAMSKIFEGINDGVVLGDIYSVVDILRDR